MKSLKARIERKTGILFGYYRSTRPVDFRVAFRVGAGVERTLTNVELGVNGHVLYAGKVLT